MRFLLLTAALVLAGCGGDSGAASSDQAVCDSQAADLGDVRALADDLGQSDSHWGPGGPKEATATAGDAVTALTGYAPEGGSLVRVVDKARDAVQELHDDLEDDETLAGNGQTAKTAGAALDALNAAC